MTIDLASPRQHLPAGEDFLLLPPTQQAHAYANVEGMFATRTIPHGQAVQALPRGAELAPRYIVDGREHGLEDYLDRGNVAGLLVLSHGRIVLERYGLGLTESGRWSSMSMVKSMTATLVGAALQDGAIASLDDPCRAISRHSVARRMTGWRSVIS